MIFLGIDTSCYTSSVYAVDEEYVYGKRQLLLVKRGGRGLRQSEAVFQHIRLLPRLFEELCGEIEPSKIKAIGVSVRPRNTEGSYMPVFTAGESFARVIASSLGIPLYGFSHQEGHIMAGIRSANAYELLDREFISAHISGGTTELLKASFNGAGFDCEIVGGTRDISAGQLIDRIGVRLGMTFPAGVHMEEAAMKAESCPNVRVHTDGAYMNISGTETKLMRMIDGISPEEASLCTLRAVSAALNKTLSFAMREHGIKDALIAGGVASDKIIREGLSSLPYNTLFASEEFSSDNAMGTAELARLVYGSKNGNGIAD